jgi:glycosyltransferase involved in cell wall biosynthesis
VLCEVEVIVVSDIKCDETRLVVSNLLLEGDTYIERRGQRGPARSRNLGLEIARGQFVLIFDDDDQLPGPTYMDFLMHAFKEPRSITYGDVAIVKENRQDGTLIDAPPEYPKLTSFDFQQIYVKNFIFTQATIIPRYALNGRRQDEFMRSLEDWEFLLSLASEVELKARNHLAAIIYKDFVNIGNRRGSTADARDFNVVMDYLYVYRRWRAPSEELRRTRETLLTSAGFAVDAQYL